MSVWALYVIEKVKQGYEKIVILGKIEAKFGSEKRAEIEAELLGGE